MTTHVSTPAGGLPAYVATPEGAGPWPGVVVIHDLAGMTRDLRNQADWLSGAGYLAAAPDLLARGSKVSCIRAILRDLRARHGPMFDEVDAVRSWLAARDDCTGTIGVIGFCMGGRYAPMVAARDKRIKACAAVYPSIENPRQPQQAEDALALAAEITCPVLVVQPGHDHVASPETYAALKESLNKRSAPTIWQYYPDAEHGFMHRKEPAANPAASVIASPQLVAFLRACLS